MKIIDGELRLEDTSFIVEETEVLVKGDLDFRNVIVSENLKRLCVEGDILIRESLFTSIESMHCNGELLIVQESELSYELPREIIGGKYVSLWVNKEIDENTIIKTMGVLSIHGKKITKLPKQISIKGLDISGTSIKSFPDWVDISVDNEVFEKWANKQGCYIDDGYFGGICVDDTPIKSIPEDLSLMGNFSIEGSQIEKLPMNMNIGGVLNISHTNIDNIPSGVSFSALKMDSTKIEELPDGFYVKGFLSADGSLKKLPKNLHVGGTFYFETDADEYELPQGLRVGALYLYKSSIDTIPKDIIIGDEPDYTWYSSSDEEEFPRGTIYTFGQNIGFEVDNLNIPGDLYLLDTNILNLPNKITVGGDCNLEIDLFTLENSIKFLPNVLHVGGTLYLPEKLRKVDFKKYGKDITYKNIGTV